MQPAAPDLLRAWTPQTHLAIASNDNSCRRNCAAYVVLTMHCMLRLWHLYNDTQTVMRWLHVK